MNRREAIKKTAFLMGGTISAAAIAGVLNGCQPSPPGISWEPQFFTLEQGEMVTVIAERIIPATDTPGAKDVGVPAFIDIMLKDNYTEKQQKAFVEGLTSLEADAQQAHGKSFVQLSLEEQDALLTQYDQAAYDARKAGEKGRPFFTMAKELTLVGYFTSEVGATEVLQYDPVPGNYEGCVPLAEVGKAWSTI